METFIGQLLALVTFFAFPAIQYLLLKRFIKKEGKPELWYLPSFGFRLVIRNIPNKKILSDIKSKTIIRKIIPSNDGASVTTRKDEQLSTREEFFLFPSNDLILLSFKLISNNEQGLIFILTDNLGVEQRRFHLCEFDCIISDYTANVENYLNFDGKIAKRVILRSESLVNIWKAVRDSNYEANYPLDVVINVG